MEKQRAVEFAKHCLDKAKDLDIRTAFLNVEEYYETFKTQSSMEKIPTAEEVIEKMVKFASFNDTINCPVWSLSKVMTDFAKIHVEAALKEAAKQADVNLVIRGTYQGAKWRELKDGESYDPLENSVSTKIDKQSILKSYPLENIK